MDHQADAAAADRRNPARVIGRDYLNRMLDTRGRIIAARLAMRGSDFDELTFFRAISTSGARALLIGRRALVVLGLPVLTADYDFWLHFDDAERFNESVSAFDLAPTHSPLEARQRGRYALENDEHIDVLIARSIPTVDGVTVAFDDVWTRRQATSLGTGVEVALPSLADLVLTKRFASRPKDLEDIRLLEILRKETGQ
jgi:hypothetical protein